MTAGINDRQIKMSSTIIIITLITLSITTTYLTKDQHKWETQVQEDVLTIEVDCKHPKVYIKL